ncbi:olfactory receptor 12D3-like [Bombina bombina]|uniref:olfactory receptor 12D3-like n=1 Tax=Bombina bombina TaxID=8345 RepID=UPI00235A8273|nr:olfactory receptor 12D3-like [Bombina bombina]
MEKLNQTLVTEFILLGITNIYWLKIPFFITFLILYMFSLVGNVSIVIVVIYEHNLHTPMYSLLSNLSFLDFCYSTTTVPKMLAGLVMNNKKISFTSCIAQLFFFHFLGSTEALLLMSMSYDRYVAICNPLRYHKIMAKKTCIKLAFGAWGTSFFYSLTHTILASRLPFCRFNNVDHFLCDIKPLLKLACSDTRLNESLVSIITGFIGIASFVLIVISYAFIGTHLMNIQTSQGRRKAFSTCTSHLTVVLLFYGTALSTYIRPATKDSLEQDRQAAVLYTAITPALNPLIYALRNKDVKIALKKHVLRRHGF